MDKNATIEDIVKVVSVVLPLLKDKQLLVITEFVSGLDALPTEELISGKCR